MIIFYFLFLCSYPLLTRVPQKIFPQFANIQTTKNTLNQSTAVVLQHFFDGDLPMMVCLSVEVIKMRMTNNIMVHM